MKKLLVSSALFLVLAECFSQQTIINPEFKLVSADSSFLQKSKSFQRLWGHNRRKEWAAQIQVPILWLDQFPGQLHPYATGGGNESNTLRLQTSAGKEYTLRSIKKSRKDVIAPEYRNTFVAAIINDGISCSYPYAAFGLAHMEEVAHIPHPIPQLVWLPRQTALDTFNNRFADALYLLEERLEGDWSEADYLGNFKDFAGTDKVIEKLQQTNLKSIDQYAFLKARLFDILIGDWDRHEDNWRWGKKDEGDKTVYIPVPRDRDQAFFTHDGILIDPLLPAVGLSFMQNFDFKFHNVRSLNIEERNMDRLFTNQLDLDDWVKAAKELQQDLTDQSIEKSIKNLSPPIFAISGKELIDKLISRRNQLIDIARAYYHTLANQVEIIGSKEKELFEINETKEGETSLAIFRVDSIGQKEEKPFYSRNFNPHETEELRIFGIGSEDIYMIQGHSAKIKLRVIGGIGRDSIIQQGNKVHIYDDPNNSIKVSHAKIHFQSDSIKHSYRYGHFSYDSRGFIPNVFFDHEDRVYTGINYNIRKYNWRREPFGSDHVIGINYSIPQRALSLSYSTIYPQLFGKWDLDFNVRYDPVRWTNFYGIGNETVLAQKSREFYRMISREAFTAVGIRRNIGNSTLNIAAIFDLVKTNLDTARNAAKIFPPSDSNVFVPNYYSGLRLIYSYVSVDDAIVPTRGISILAKANYLNNFTQKEFFQSYSLSVAAFIPITKRVSLAIKGGGNTIVGRESTFNSVQVMQHAVIGGPETLRGYRMERFWGKSAYYNTNELRYIFPIRSYLLNATAGILGFFDDGRVWTVDDQSDKIHTSYGAGFFLAPFDKICMTLTYGISPESKLFQLRINTLF